MGGRCKVACTAGRLWIAKQKCGEDEQSEKEESGKKLLCAALWHLRRIKYTTHQGTVVMASMTVAIKIQLLSAVALT